MDVTKVVLKRDMALAKVIITFIVNDRSDITLTNSANMLMGFTLPQVTLTIYIVAELCCFRFEYKQMLACFTNLIFFL